MTTTTQTTFSNIKLSTSPFLTSAVSIEERYSTFTEDWIAYVKKIDKAFEEGNKEKAKNTANNFIEYLNENSCRHDQVFQYLTQESCCYLETYKLLEPKLDFGVFTHDVNDDRYNLEWALHDCLHQLESNEVISYFIQRKPVNDESCVKLHHVLLAICYNYSIDIIKQMIDECIEDLNDAICKERCYMRRFFQERTLH